MNGGGDSHRALDRKGLESGAGLSMIRQSPLVVIKMMADSPKNASRPPTARPERDGLRNVGSTFDTPISPLPSISHSSHSPCVCLEYQKKHNILCTTNLCLSRYTSAGDSATLGHVSRATLPRPAYVLGAPILPRKSAPWLCPPGSTEADVTRVDFDVC